MMYSSTKYPTASRTFNALLSRCAGLFVNAPLLSVDGDGRPPPVL